MFGLVLPPRNTARYALFVFMGFPFLGVWRFETTTRSALIFGGVVQMRAIRLILVAALLDHEGGNTH
jgi:hypothetical protein